MTPLLEDLDRARAAATSRRRERPFVTLAYAQSVDGSIARTAGERFALSGPEAMRMTHAIRGRHDAILVGVGTVLADDPELSVRLVEAGNPQPIVVDSRLRTPAAARLLAPAARRPWIATTASPAAFAGPAPVATRSADGLKRHRAAALEERGARLLMGPELANGWVNLAELLRRLRREGIEALMVEGGAQIISSFLGARLVDYAVVTLAPLFLGGLSVLQPGWAGIAAESGGAAAPAVALPRLRAWVSQRLGDDLVMAGELDWRDP
jgi:3,4-dihydroxy 2-butanone 4-phosphate synthase/GTP cyclohydrolase II